MQEKKQKIAEVIKQSKASGKKWPEVKKDVTLYIKLQIDGMDKRSVDYREWRKLSYEFMADNTGGMKNYLHTTYPVWL